ncbi:unnamed protein product [Clavelina lepadiformis]|uniref:SMB domain-containing protein n=1 Tax=Clavelina lepadiformis TaxID=159417 RepID=A0ABP0H523_CLALP
MLLMWITLCCFLQITKAQETFPVTENHIKRERFPINFDQENVYHIRRHRREVFNLAPFDDEDYGYSGSSESYCAERRDPTTSQKVLCCPGRNDTCSLPYYGTLCYCDEFCAIVDSGGDCCPDHVDACRGGEGSGSGDGSGSGEGSENDAGSTPLPSYIQIPPLEAPCFFDDLKFQAGQVITINCNRCVCEKMPADYYAFNCSQLPCIMQPNVIEAINEGGYGWQAANYNFLSSLTLSDAYAKRLGTLKPSEVIRNMSAMSKLNRSPNIPESFDARHQWPSLILQPRDQGNCAASWAFSATGVASDRVAIQFGKNLVELSPEHLMSCYSRTPCQGDHIDKAWWCLRKHGLVSSLCYPYAIGFTDDTQRLSSCRFPYPASEKCPTTTEDVSSQRIKLSPAYRVNSDESSIMEEIWHNGPVQAIMKVRPDFFVYKSGIYSSTPVENEIPSEYEDNNYHSVKLVGWGSYRTPATETKYWIAQNSWGEEWGEKGYFRIKRGIKESGIEDMILAAWAH